MHQLHVVSPSSDQAEDPASVVAGALRAHFQTGATKSLSWRLFQLDALEHFLMEREQDILDALRADLGKPAMEAFGSEIGLPLSELRLVRKKLASWMKPERVRTSLLAMPGRSYIYREPLGVTLIIAPWNYPFQLLVSPLIGAIAAGNCAALKPSEIAPRISALVAKWIPKYLDKNAIRVVEGGVPETTSLLRQHWDHIFYTGNGKVGRIILEAAAQHLTPVTLELGGKSPCIVDESADLDTAAKRIVYGKFFNAGQTCLAPDYILVHEHVHDALVNRLVSTIREFYGDDPRQSPDFGRIVNERHHARLTRLLDGVDVVTDSLAARARIGSLPHGSGLYPHLTARENIAYYARLYEMPPDTIDAAVQTVIDQLDINDFADRRTKGFSQGQRTKVSLARALVHGPQNILLDEPSNGLDVMATRSLRERIRELKAAGKCVLFSSHVMQEVAALCDEIVIIAAGQVALHDTTDGIRRATGCDDLEEAFVKAIGMVEPVS